MNKTPFISVLLPTKNRSQIFGYAIQSVLNQTFEDFEVVIVDNDDGDATEKAYLGMNITDSRVKYFRTGGLNMSENWEYALDQAKGRYVTVLEDKQAYYDDALKKVYKLIADCDVNVVVWNWDSFDDKRKQVSCSGRPGKGEIFTSDEILNIYVNNPAEAWKYLPRMINSIAPMSMVRKLKKKSKVDGFFSEVAPDLCAAFQLLSMGEKIYVTNNSCGVLGYMHMSYSTLVMKSKSADYYGRGGIAEKAVDQVPIKEVSLVHNTVYNDFLRIRNRVGGRLINYQMSSDVYARLCVGDLILNLKRGRLQWSQISSVQGYARQIDLPLLPLVSCFLMGVVRHTARPIFAYIRRLVGGSNSMHAETILDAAALGKINCK